MPELPSRTASLRVSSRGFSYLGWLAIAWIVVFWRLGYPTLMDPDEAHYAQLTREMLRSGNWLVPLLDGHPLIDKPVLFHWMQGAFVILLGESELAVRLPSALSALALFALTRWAGMALLGAEVGEWGAIMFATIPATFALSSIGLFDMVFTTFLFGGLACLLVAAEARRPRVERVGYGLLALAVMTKGPVALVLMLLFLGAAWLLGGEARERVRRLHWPTGLLFAALAASPWFVWMHGRFGAEFVQGYILAGNLWYFTQPEAFSSRVISHTFYARAFGGAFFPWSAVIAGRAVDLLRRRRTGLSCSTAEQLLWLWAIIVVGFFSAARFKLDHYIFPAAPACCLIAAKAWHDAARDEHGAARGTRFSVFAIAAMLLVAGSFGSVYLFELNLDLPAAAIALPIALAVGGGALLTVSALNGWRVPRTALVPVVTLLSAYAAIVMIGYPALQEARPTALVGRTLRTMTPPDAPVGIYRLEQWRGSLRYYTERPLLRLSSPEDVLALVSPGRPVYVVMLRRDYRELRASGVRLREVFRSRAVVGTTRTRSGLRRQQWDDLIIVTDAPSRARRPLF
jgi:4-amino-4-deoxy-L-arabinose transferase-like glycosyltransferase